MKPNELQNISKTGMTAQMLCLNAKRDMVLTDGQSTPNDVVFNSIDPISDEVTFTQLYRYDPQKGEYIDDSNLYTIKTLQLGYFKDIVIDEGTVRIISG